MKRALTAILIGCGIVLAASPAMAGIKVEPTVTELVLQPGKQAEGKYVVTNTGQTPLKITISLEDWLGRLFGTQDSIAVTDWLKMETDSLDLKPGETKEVKYKAVVPADFIKEKVAQVFFAFSENPNLTSRLGVIFYLSPADPEKLQAELQKFTIQHEQPEGKAPNLKLWFQIKNDSSVHIRPSGILTILDPSTNDEIKQIVLNPVPGIYPGKTFTWVQRYPLELPRGFYKAKLTLDYGKTYGREGLMESTAEFHWEPQTKPAPEAAAEKGESGK